MWNINYLLDTWAWFTFELHIIIFEESNARDNVRYYPQKNAFSQKEYILEMIGMHVWSTRWE